MRVTSWGYRCPNPDCPTPETIYRSAEAEGLHLKSKQFGRDVIVHVGYRRFWYHHTMYEIHEWLTQDLELAVSESQVFYLIIVFLALLGAAQSAKVRDQLKTLKRLIIGSWIRPSNLIKPDALVKTLPKLLTATWLSCWSQ